MAFSIKQLFVKSNNPIIHNRYILYFIFFISLADLFYLSVERDFISIAIFILIGVLTSFFDKNMLVILFIALTLTNILKYGKAIRHEGFEDADESNEVNEQEQDTDIHLSKNQEGIENKENPDKYEKNKITNGPTSTKEIINKLQKIVDIMKS